MKRSYVVNDATPHRCFLCGKLIEGSCLVHVDDQYPVDEEEYYFCGECVYHSENIGRPHSPWESQKSKDDKIRREQERIEKARREHEEWLAKFCCRKWGEFIYTLRNFNQTVVLDNGVIMLYNYDCYDDYDSRDFDDSGKYHFTYCPYCRKEFIRK